MSVAPRASILALIVAGLPAVAHAGAAFTGVRTVAGLDGEGRVESRTAGHSADSAQRLGATVENMDGVRASLDCATVGVRQSGGAGLEKPVTVGDVSLKVEGATGTIGIYKGFVETDGTLVLLDDTRRGLSPAVGGFLLANAEGKLEVRVWVDDAAEAVESALLRVDGAAVAVAFASPEETWSCGLPVADPGPWTLNAKLEVSTVKSGWKQVDALTADLGVAWASDDKGVSSLSLGDAGLSSLALLPPAVDGCGWGAGCADPNAHALVAVSDGWAPDDALPTHLDLTSPAGDILRVPLNSAQRTGAAALTFAKDPTGLAVDVLDGGDTVRVEAGGPVACGTQSCFRIARGDKSWALVVTAYRAAASELPRAVKVGFDTSGTDEGVVAPTTAGVTVTLAKEAALVFARTVTPGQGAAGASISFKPSLIGLEQDGIHTTTYTAGGMVRSALGDGVRGLTLVALDRSGPAVMEPEALVGGEPIGLDRSSDDAEAPEPVGPPVVWGANGAGTRSAIPSVRNKPGLR